MVICRVCLKEKGAVNRILKSGLTYLGFHYDREVGNGNRRNRALVLILFISPSTSLMERYRELNKTWILVQHSASMRGRRNTKHPATLCRFPLANILSSPNFDAEGGAIV